MTKFLIICQNDLKMLISVYERSNDDNGQKTFDDLPELPVM